MVRYLVDFAPDSLALLGKQQADRASLVPSIGTRLNIA
jgi:hypothetical protein